jgi:hypothetical protein
MGSKNILIQLIKQNSSRIPCFYVYSYLSVLG